MYYRGDEKYRLGEWYTHLEGVNEWTVLQATRPQTYTIVHNRYKLKFVKETLRILATDLKTGEEFYLAQLYIK